MGDSEIAHSEDVHADKGVYACVERYFRKSHHGKHDPIRKRDVDQMCSGCQHSTADTYFLGTYRS